MVKKLYLIAGIVFEVFVIGAYIKDKPQYRKIDYLVGGVIDIVAWPIVLLENIIRWSR